MHRFTPTLRRTRAALRWLSREIGFRFLTRRRAACVVAVLTMALAIGTNATVFGVVKAFLLSSFALPDPSRLVVIAPVRDLPGRGGVVFLDAYPNYETIRASQRVFADVATAVQGVASWDHRGDVRALQAARVTASFFATMRAHPVLGQPFASTAEGVAPEPVVLVSHALWRTDLGGTSAVIGSTMLINGVAHTVIGVMPRGFTHPLPTDIWLPFSLPQRQFTTITGARILTTYGRLRPGLSKSAAHAEAAALTQRTLEASSDNRDFRYTMPSIRDVLVPGAGRTVLFVQAGALVVLFLAVLNLASLLIAWAFERRREMAVRLALGAPGGRIVRLMFFQSIAVVGLGSVCGVGLAAMAIPAIRQLHVSPVLELYLSHLKLDAAVLGWTAGITALAGVLAGALPSWFVRNASVGQALHGSSRSTSLSPGALRWQKLTVLSQATLSVIVLAGAALVGVSFKNIIGVQAGFAAGNRAVARVQLSDASYPTHETRAVFASRLLQALAREPELGEAAFTSTLPVGDVPNGARFFVQPPDGSNAVEPLLLHIRRVSASYLATMGIPLTRGRAFEPSDDASRPTVIIVSRAFADRVWPGEDPVGKFLYRVVAGNAPQPGEIVGVASSVLDAGYNAPAGETVYVPFAQFSANRMSIVVEPRGAPSAAIAAVRRALRATDPVVAATGVTSLEALVRQSNALPRLQIILLMTFAVVSVGIVALGCYGVMAQLVANREREFAVRLVYGAAPGSLASKVFGQVARITVPGILVGLAAVWMLAGVLRPFVFGVDPRSEIWMLVAGTSVLTLALVATVPSALRATRTDIRKGITAA